MYQKYDILDNNNKYKCESCNKLSNASKKMTIVKTANVLIINLNRHKFDRKSKKNTIPITFKKKMSIFNKNYNLINIIEHTSGGENSNSGHYINKSLNQNKFISGIFKTPFETYYYVVGSILTSGLIIEWIKKFINAI